MIKPVVFVLLLTISNTLLSHPGIGIVMDSKGNVFYTDLKQIWKIDRLGKATVAVPHVHSHELYIDKQDNLFGEHLWYEGEATDKWGHFVWRLSAQGKLEKVIPDTEGFLRNYSFVRDSHGHMFTVHRETKCQKLMQYTADRHGRQLGNACFDDVRWMTSSESGNLYMVDAESLKKVDATGHAEVMAKNFKERKLSQAMVNDNHLAMGLWTDKKENVYVAIFGARQVKKISPDKEISIVAETSALWSPTGGFVAPNGDFWLLECSPTNAVRVEKITTTGERIIYSDN